MEDFNKLPTLNWDVDDDHSDRSNFPPQPKKSVRVDRIQGWKNPVAKAYLVTVGKSVATNFQLLVANLVGLKRLQILVFG